MNLEKIVKEMNKRLENIEMIVIENTKILNILKESNINIINPNNLLTKDRNNFLKDSPALCIKSQETIGKNKLKEKSKKIENENENIETNFTNDLYKTSKKKFALKNMDQNVNKCSKLITKNNNKFEDHKIITIKLKENSKGNASQLPKSEDPKEYNLSERNFESIYKRENSIQKRIEHMAQTLRPKNKNSSFFSFSKDINRIFSPHKKSNKCEKTIIIEDIDLDFTDKKNKSGNCFSKYKLSANEVLKNREMNGNMMKVCLKNRNKEMKDNSKMNNKEQFITKSFYEKRSTDFRTSDSTFAFSRNINSNKINSYITQNYIKMKDNTKSKIQSSIPDCVDSRFESLNLKSLNIISEYLGKEYKSLLKLNKNIRISMCKFIIQKCKEDINTLINKNNSINGLSMFNDQELFVNNFKFTSGLIESIKKLDSKLSLDCLKVKFDENDVIIFNCLKQLGKCFLFQFESKILKATELKSIIK